MTDVVIKDPDGPAARVIDGQLQSKSIIETALESISLKLGQAYSYTSTFTTGSIGVEILTIKNDINQHMQIDQVWVGALDAAIFSIGHVTSGTPAGTTVIGGPLNEELSQVADTTAFGNAPVTGTVVNENKAWLLTPVNTTIPFDLEGAWVYGKDDTFGVRCDTDTTVYVTVILHMSPILF